MGERIEQWADEIQEYEGWKPGSRRKWRMRTKQTGAATDRLISKERLKRLTHQNEKLNIEMQRLRGEVGPIEDFKHVVLRANSVVKLQILSVPIRVGPTLGLTRA